MALREEAQHNQVNNGPGTLWFRWPRSIKSSEMRACTAVTYVWKCRLYENT